MKKTGVAAAAARGLTSAAEEEVLDRYGHTVLAVAAAAMGQVNLSLLAQAAMTTPTKSRFGSVRSAAGPTDSREDTTTAAPVGQRRLQSDRIQSLHE